MLYTSSFFGDELWPADKLGFTKTAIQAKPDSVYFVVNRYINLPHLIFFANFFQKKKTNKIIETLCNFWSPRRVSLGLGENTIGFLIRLYYYKSTLWYLTINPFNLLFSIWQCKVTACFSWKITSWKLVWPQCNVSFFWNQTFCRGAEVDVKRLPKRPAPPRFGRALTEAQKAIYLFFNHMILINGHFLLKLFYHFLHSKQMELVSRTFFLLSFFFKCLTSIFSFLNIWQLYVYFLNACINKSCWTAECSKKY